MRRIGWIFAFCCVLMLGAGMVLGYWYSQRKFPPPVGPEWMRTLSLDQRNELDAIWKPARKKFEDLGDRSRQLAQQRDQAVRGLLSANEQAAFDKIDSDYHAGRAAIDAQRDRMRLEIDRKIRDILTEEQKAKFDVETKDRHRHGAGTRPTTQKAGAQPASTQPSVGP